MQSALWPRGITNGLPTHHHQFVCSPRLWRPDLRVREARQLGPDFIQIPARPQRDAQVSTAIMDALKGFTPSQSAVEGLRGRMPMSDTIALGS